MSRFQRAAFLAPTPRGAPVFAADAQAAPGFISTRDPLA